MKLKTAILLLLGANDNEPVPDLLHLTAELVLVDQNVKIENYDAAKAFNTEVKRLETKT